MHVVALSEGPCVLTEGDAELGVAVLSSPGELWLAHTSPDGAVGPLLRRIDTDCPQMSAMMAATDSTQGVYAMACRAHAGAELVRASCEPGVILRTQLHVCKGGDVVLSVWWWPLGVVQTLVAFNCTSGEVDYSASLGQRVVSAVTASPDDGLLVASHLADAASAELGRVDAVSGQYIAMRVMTTSTEAAPAGLATGRYVDGAVWRPSCF